MKIKLTQPGYENFTGQLGNVTFTDGTSDGEVSEQSAAGIAAVYLVDQVVAGVDTGVLNTTNVELNVEDNTGDFNAATNPAPTV